MEQEVIEISWVLTAAGLKERLKLARNPGTENFIAIIESVERSQAHLRLDALKDSFRELANERNLIVHGAWTMTDEKPWVVWHKFVEDTESIIGEHFEAWRFERFMTKGSHILDTLRKFHNMLEAQTGALAEFERSLIRERTQAGLAAARRIGRTGGRPPKLTVRTLRPPRRCWPIPTSV